MLLQAVERVRVRARRVIEIEKHRRALRGGFEQIAEFSEHVRADRVALVRDQVPAVRILVDKNIEMVEPEIGKLLGELPLAVNCADHFRFHQFVYDFILVLEGQGIHAARLLGQILQMLLIFVDLHPQPLGGNVLRRILIEQPRSAEPQRRELREARIHHRVADIFRMKLRLNPVLEAGFFDLFHLAGAGTKSKPVEGVQDGFLFVQLADRKFAGEVCVAAAFVTPARGHGGEEYNSAPLRRGPAQASVARDSRGQQPRTERFPPTASWLDHTTGRRKDRAEFERSSAIQFDTPKAYESQPRVDQKVPIGRGSLIAHNPCTVNRRWTWHLRQV